MLLSWARLEPSTGLLGPSGGQLGASWGHLGNVRVTETKKTFRRNMCFWLCRRALGQDGYLEACWGHLGAIFGPLWTHLGTFGGQDHQEPLGSARGAARETPSSITGNVFKALSCHTSSTASAIHTTTLSVPLPDRFSPQSGSPGGGLTATYCTRLCNYVRA